MPKALSLSTRLGTPSSTRRMVLTVSCQWSRDSNGQYCPVDPPRDSPIVWLDSVLEWACSLGWLLELPSLLPLLDMGCVFASRSVCPFALLLVEWAKRNHLSRRCNAPTDAADITHHRQSYPISVISLTTRSPPRLVTAGTFSRNMNLGLISLAKRMISKNSPLRSPSNPFPFPAMLMSWHGHGKPPKMISISSVTSGSPL